MSYEIFAHHAHVFPENVRPDGTVDALLRTMDECGIARAVCFATFPSQLKAENEETNAWLAKRIRGEDRQSAGTKKKNGVGEGIRTLGLQSHNLTR